MWSRVRESNPPSRLGKPLYYRYTNPAACEDIIADLNIKFKSFLSRFGLLSAACALRRRSIENPIILWYYEKAIRVISLLSRS